MKGAAPCSMGYAAEMLLIEQDIADIGDDVLSRPGNTPQISKYVYRRYQKASIAGDLRGLSAVEPLIDRAIALLANPSDFYVLKANLALKLHRLADVRAVLAACPSVDQSREAKMIRADLDFQQGRYEEAKRGYCEALDLEMSWDGLARLAYFHAQMGDVSGADGLYAQAEDELTAKEMRSFAWLRIQRGLLDFRHGRYAEAQAHYATAEAGYPGYPLVDEHVAELLAAQGHTSEAAERFDRIGAMVTRPELDQARGELYEIMGEIEIARSWQKQALDAYLASAERGEVHYYHHMVDYYCDVVGCGSEAVKWALRDLELRENFATQAALAWALYRDGKPDDAVLWIDRALASGAIGPGLLSKAASIHSAAGNESLGKSYRERAESLNPSLGSFHLHH